MQASLLSSSTILLDEVKIVTLFVPLMTQVETKVVLSALLYLAYLADTSPTRSSQNALSLPTPHTSPGTQHPTTHSSHAWVLSSYPILQTFISNIEATMHMLIIFRM